MLQKPLVDEAEATESAAQETQSEDEHSEEVSSGEGEPFVHPDDMQAQEEQEETSAVEETSEDSADMSQVVSALREELAVLRKELAESRKGAEEEGGEGGVESEYELTPVSGITFVKEDEDPADLTMSAEGLNEFGVRVLNAAVQAAVTHAFTLAQSEANKAVSTYAYSKEFYDRYPELRGHGDVVMEVSKEIEAKDPKITPQQLFMDTAKRAYAKLGKRMPTADKRSPGFTKAGASQMPGGVSQKPKTVQDDIRALLKHKGLY